MYRFPRKRGDPLDVTFERITDWLTRLWIPQANLMGQLQLLIRPILGKFSTYLPVVSTCGQLPLHCFPLYTQNPTFVTCKNMRRRFREQIP